MQHDRQILANGIDGRTGTYGQPPRALSDLAAEIRGCVTRDLEIMPVPRTELDLENLANAGWAVVFPAGFGEDCLEALAPLFRLRREQASAGMDDNFRAIEWNPSRGALDLRALLGVGPCELAPERLPYYIVIVGPPDQIRYSFQFQLDVRYSVGRISFSKADQYARYAEQVVAAETGGAITPRKRATFFGAANGEDRLSNLCSEMLVGPLATHARDSARGWTVETLLGEQATKERLRSLLGGPESPAFLFTGGHAVRFAAGDDWQEERQGGLVCSDWPGPGAWDGPLEETHYFWRGDLHENADLAGMVAFLLGCYSVGTPANSLFAAPLGEDPAQVAERSFVAALPQAMLSNERGGALAVIGHVDTAYEYSFYWNGVGSQIEAYRKAVGDILSGRPVGMAMDHFSRAYSILAADFNSILCGLREGSQEVCDEDLVAAWTALNDARSFALVGDPAVRLRAGS